jgi:hypothetical protein
LNSEGEGERERGREGERERGREGERERDKDISKNGAYFWVSWTQSIIIHFKKTNNFFGHFGSFFMTSIAPRIC